MPSHMMAAVITHSVGTGRGHAQPNRASSRSDISVPETARGPRSRFSARPSMPGQGLSIEDRVCEENTTAKRIVTDENLEKFVSVNKFGSEKVGIKAAIAPNQSEHLIFPHDC